MARRAKVHPEIQTALDVSNRAWMARSRREHTIRDRMKATDTEWARLYADFDAARDAVPYRELHDHPATVALREHEARVLDADEELRELRERFDVAHAAYEQIRVRIEAEALT